MEYILGGKLCFSLSAFSESFSTSVYRKRLHRILNLMSDVLEDFFTRAARTCESVIFQRVFSLEKRCSGLGGHVVAGCGGMGARIGEGIHFASLRLEISMNCLMSLISEGMLGGCGVRGRGRDNA